MTNYRRWDRYVLDITVFPEQEIQIPKLLPSEPEEGITYEFGPSGFIGSSESRFCIIPAPGANFNNYCHWTLMEVPLVYLALSSPARKIVLPDQIVQVKQPFQKRWFEVLNQVFPNKEIIPRSEFETDDTLLLMPVNHDSSLQKKPVGKAKYEEYHWGRATPYALEVFQQSKSLFHYDDNLKIEKIYINRKNRRLINELEVQEHMESNGFVILDLEELTLDQQVQLFSNADEIVGFHGAGLTNLIFCTDKTRIIEIVDQDCVYPSFKDGVHIPGKKANRTYFHMIAHMKNLNYSVLESREYTLDLEKLAKALS